MPDLRDPSLSDLERDVLMNVGTYGWHCMHVSDEDEPVYWTYSIGIFKNWRLPELVIFGLQDKIGHAVLGDFVRDLEGGETFEADKQYEVFAGGYEAMFLTVDQRWQSSFLGFAQWFYDYGDFPALQCVWPDKDGLLPWEPGFDAESPPQPLLISEADAERIGYQLDVTRRSARTG